MRFLPGRCTLWPIPPALAAMTHKPISSPVCGRLTIEPLLRQIRITAELEGVVQDVRALDAFMCESEGHIFFIRASDLGRADPVRATA